MGPLVNLTWTCDLGHALGTTTVNGTTIIEFFSIIKFCCNVKCWQSSIKTASKNIILISEKYLKLYKIILLQSLKSKSEDYFECSVGCS
jgi:hypothetical protein